jgi:hypothetical protein
VQECTPPKLSGDRAEVAERDQGAAHWSVWHASRVPDGREHYSRWLPSLRSTCMDGTWGHVVGVVLPLRAVITGLYLWRRNVVVIIAHFLLDLPLVLVALGVSAQVAS